LIDLNGDQTLFQLLMILEIAGQGSPGRLRRQKIWSAEVIRVEPCKRYYDAFDNNLLERVIIKNPAFGSSTPDTVRGQEPNYDPV